MALRYYTCEDTSNIPREIKHPRVAVSIEHLTEQTMCYYWKV